VTTATATFECEMEGPELWWLWAKAPNYISEAATSVTVKMRAFMTNLPMLTQ